MSAPTHERRRGYPTPRRPKEGREAEFAAVSSEALRAVELIDEEGKDDAILDVLTSPRHPGLFSPSLDALLCDRAKGIIDAIWLLRRLRSLSVGPPGCDVVPKDAPSIDGGTFESEAGRWWFQGLLPEERQRIEQLSRVEWNRMRVAREANRKLPDHCSSCGSKLEPCMEDGGYWNEHRRQNRGREAPARRCATCDKVMPNAPPPGVIDLAARRRR